MKNFICACLCLLAISFGFAQSEDKFIIPNNNDFRLSFESINNLTLIPVTLNGKPLTFLLDTGVKHTLLFNLSQKDSLELKNAERIRIRGLDGSTTIEGLRSNGAFKIGDATNTNHPFYILFNLDFNFSKQLGIPVHGIIGYGFFKDLVVEKNYIKNRLRVYSPEKYNSKKRCRGCTALSIVFEDNKPYLEANIRIEDNVVSTKLLIDSGSSDGLWLFENSSDDITIPKNSFEDYLGLGLTGDILGERSRVDHLKIDKFKLYDVNTSFPDTLSMPTKALSNDRNGTIGSEILRRFKVVIDYPNKRIFLKKNKDFKDKFTYDMSGLIIEHQGFKAYKEKIKTEDRIINLLQEDLEESSDLASQKKEGYHYFLKPQLVVVYVRKGSPADKAGLLAGDILIKIDNKYSFEYTLKEITSLLASKEGRRIKFEIERYAVNLNRTLVLKSRL